MENSGHNDDEELKWAYNLRHPRKERGFTNQGTGAETPFFACEHCFFAFFFKSDDATVASGGGDSVRHARLPTTFLHIAQQTEEMGMQHVDAKMDAGDKSTSTSTTDAATTRDSRTARVCLHLIVERSISMRRTYDSI